MLSYLWFNLKKLNAGCRFGYRWPANCWRTIEPRHVHIVIANIGNEFTIKRLYQQNGVVELRSENRNRQNELPNYTFKDGDFLQVVGIVLHVIKKVGWARTSANFLGYVFTSNCSFRSCKLSWYFWWYSECRLGYFDQSISK